MQNLENIEDEISAACDQFPYDFTPEQQDYIRTHADVQNALLAWFGTRLSDGCWTENNVRFLRSLMEEQETA